MDIVSRLKFFLSHNGISNSTFADTCDIPRPTLSQLLNGRNKKVSDELITKIHNAYPALNIMWLMFGDGDMFVPNAKSLPSPTAAQPAENAEFLSATDVASEAQTAPMTSISFDGEESAYQAPSPMPAAAISAALQSMTKKAPKPAMVKNQAVASQGRRVTSIMVFYSDNSFEEFIPR
ncbi:MAG: helix-turn-helix transcriptional regulator [Bacteroidales bacterium]|nr:helix-turn-helix transcriptional regulator [Bacteroidales bacterium]